MRVVTTSERIDFVRRAFGRFIHDATFTNVAISCPYCPPAKSRVKKKLVIHIERWVYHCWRCGSSGRSLVPLLRVVGAHDLIDEFVSKFTQQKQSAPDAAEVTTPQDTKLRLPRGFRLLVACDDGDINARTTAAYLRSRGLDKHSQWRFRLGIADDEQHLQRVIVPSFDVNGVLNYYTSRRIDGRSFMKYLNSDVPRNDIVFNEIDVDWSQRVVLVEGPFDAMKCPDNAIPLLGCQFNEESLLFERILVSMPPVVVMLDDDTKKRAWKIAKHLSSYGVDVSIASVPAHDPGMMHTCDVAETIAQAVPWSRDDAARAMIAEL